MSNLIQVRRGTSAQRQAMTLSNGEPGWDTDTKQLYMGDGVTPGGILVPTLSPSFKNKLINGNFDIWQRQTGFTATGYTADRWLMQATSVTSPSASQLAWSAGDPTANPSEATYLISLNNTGNSDATNHQFFLSQRMESVRTYAGKTVTLSFSAYSPSTRPIAVTFNQNYGVSGSTTTSPAPQTVNLLAGWNSYKLQFAIPSISGKTIGTGDYLALFFWLSAGTAFNAGTNSLGAQTGQVAFATVQLEPGTVATPFEIRPLEQEMAMCQRYYEKSYNLAAPPGSVTTSSANNFYMAGLSSTTRNLTMWTPFRVTKRAIPTVSVYSPQTGAISKVYDQDGASDIPLLATANNGSNGFGCYCGPTVATTTINALYHWTADAEL